MATGIVDLNPAKVIVPGNINMMEMILQKSGVRWLVDTMIVTITVSQLLVALLVAAFIFISF